MRFIPRLEILPPSQRALWLELPGTPEHFTLYGGTALALRLGHRSSVDFDFFSNQSLDPDKLIRDIPYLDDAERVQVDRNTLTCRVDRGGPVLVSFFGGLRLGRIETPSRLEDGGISIASLLDLAGAKVAVVQKRAEAKDYVDIDALLRHGIDLPTALAAGQVVYGRDFNPMITLKALSYFDDVPGLGGDIQERLSTAVSKVDPAHLPVLKPQIARSPTQGRGPRQ